MKQVGWKWQENRSNQRIPHPSATLSNTNPTRDSLGSHPTLLCKRSTTTALRKIPTTAYGMVHYVPHSLKSNLCLICWIYNSCTQALTNIHSLAKRQCVIKNTESPRKLHKVISSYKIIVLQWLLHVKTVWLPMTNLFTRKPQPRKPMSSWIILYVKLCLLGAQGLQRSCLLSGWWKLKFYTILRVQARFCNKFSFYHTVIKATQRSHSIHEFKFTKHNYHHFCKYESKFKEKLYLTALGWGLKNIVMKLLQLLLHIS